MPPMGRNGGHQWGDSEAAYGEVFMATVRPSNARKIVGPRGSAALPGGPASRRRTPATAPIRPLRARRLRHGRLLLQLAERRSSGPTLARSRL